MKRVSIADPEFTYDDADPEGFRVGMFRFGPKLGAAETGASVYELPPGQALCPYHYECGEEEWLMALIGNVTVRHPEGTEVLEPWEITCFRRGPDGAHQIWNDTDETVRIMMFSTLVLPSATVYPDSGKIGIWTGRKEDDVIVRRSSAVDYYDGESRTGDSPGS